MLLTQKHDGLILVHDDSNMHSECKNLSRSIIQMLQFSIIVILIAIYMLKTMSSEILV